MLKGIAIVGIGLIGGSVGLAARTKNLAGRVIGIGRSQEKLAQAVALGAISEYSLDFESIADCDVVVICTPVGLIARDALLAAAHAKPDTLIMDAGSTKGKLIADIQPKLPAAINFVGCHPIAGSQRAGVAAARADLFENRLTIITPTAANRNDALQRAREFWQALGSRLYEMDPQLHDEALATTSHLPHLLAAAMALTTPKEWLEFTGGGWRDQTRIAAGEPGNWTQIFLANRHMLLKSLTSAEENIAKLRAAIESNNPQALETLLIKGKEHRDALGD